MKKGHTKTKWTREFSGSVGPYYALRWAPDPSSDWFTALALARKLEQGGWELCIRRFVADEWVYDITHHKYLNEAKNVARVHVRFNQALTH